MTYLPSPWIHISTPRPHPRLRVFCVPYAGGGASVYRGWGAQLPPDIELCAVRLPGHEGRFAEPPVLRMERLVERMADGLAPYMDRGFALFGHSMGAAVAFELARYLVLQGRAAPLHVFVAGRGAPQFVRARHPGEPALHALPDAVLVAALRRLGGVSDEVLAVPELLEVLLPALRADLELDDAFTYQAGPPLACPVTVFGGADDETVTREQLAGWQAHTRGQFALDMEPGDHFFLHSRAEALVTAIARALEA